MPLRFRIGQCTAIGPKKRNEDAIAITTPTDESLRIKGLAVALADGVSGSDNGQLAARLAVKGLIADYYATPDTWAIPQALDKVLVALNRWLMSQGGGTGQLVTTLSAVILRGRRYHLAHVGDTRIYLLRNQTLQCLTTDHVWDQPGMQHVLRRALGLDLNLMMDYRDDVVESGDVFLLVCDGVWEPLGDKNIHALLQNYADPQEAADAIVAAALQAGSQDNCSAVILRVDELPTGDYQDWMIQSQLLPLPHRLKAGQIIDGFQIEEVIHDSRATLLYKVQCLADGQTYVLKTLQPLLTNDHEAQQSLVSEEWLLKRLTAHYFPQVMPLGQENRSALYYVMSWHAGESLGKKLARGQHFSVADTVGIGIRLAKALGILHRLNIVHRDIKPDNIHIGDDGKLRVLDLGVALASGLPSAFENINPGTPSFMAPELYQGVGASVASDIYATGVSLYYTLTRHYPYGEVEPFQTPRFGEPVPPTRYRPNIPLWLEAWLLKAVHKDPKQRFETAEEMLLQLERGESQPAFATRQTPLAERDPTRMWQAIAVISLTINLLMVYLLAIR